MPMHGARLWAKHPAVRSGEKLTPGERAADFLKKWFGTWTALFGVGVAIAAWILLQKTTFRWDIYPFILLNLCLSCLAAVQGIILQISANRGDRISAQVALHTQTNTDELMGLNQRQLDILGRLDGLDGKVADLARAVTAGGLADVLAEVKAVRVLVTPAGPVPAAAPAAGKDAAAASGMGSRITPKRP